MITKVISGGQIGADIAALKAAKSLGIETGGWIPKGFRTLAGSKPEYAEEFGLVENVHIGYADRTYLNVRDSDGTLRFAYNFESPGERCTLKALKSYNKPFIDVVMLQSGEAWISVLEPPEITEWLNDNAVGVLNVAGNANKSIEVFVYNFMREVLSGTDRPG